MRVSISRLLLLLCRWSLVICPFHLHNTLSNSSVNVLYFDCLYYHNERHLAAYQDLVDVIDEFIPYCFRPVNTSSALFSAAGQPNGVKISFAELSSWNVTTEQLLAWSISIDVVERYQFYVNERRDELSEYVYNCTDSWFGNRCQYSFTPSEHMLIAEIVRDQFGRRTAYPPKLVQVRQLPCYVHLSCSRGGTSLCLDWREVCDGHVDCFDGGEDEAPCDVLESNECLEDEYRCHNGLCIPEILWNSGDDDADCLDRSDESTDDYAKDCFHDPSFRCEEHACRETDHEFPCGDGQCVMKFQPCHNGRHRALAESMFSRGNLSADCYRALVCLTNANDHIEKPVSCENQSTHDCASMLSFPIVPVHSDHVHFLYSRSQLARNSNNNSIPDYICYDEQLCDFLMVKLTHENRSCVPSESLEPFEIEPGDPWIDLMGWIDRVFRSCSVMLRQREQQNNSALYFCRNSSKSISKYRILDSNVDCHLEDDEDPALSCATHVKHRFQCADGEHCLSPMLGPIYCLSTESAGTTNIPFTKICDGILEADEFEDINSTGESDCDTWPCNNMYTRCDQFWMCRDGKDEAMCEPTGCAAEQFACISPVNRTLLCLSAKHVNDSVDDCLGAFDEADQCLTAHPPLADPIRFRCSNDNICLPFSQLCDGDSHCTSSDEDERFCSKQRLACDDPSMENSSMVEKLFCRQYGTDRSRYFSVHTSSNYPLSTTSPREKPIRWPQNPPAVVRARRSSTTHYPWPWLCHRGLIVSPNQSHAEQQCLCPPSYYGNSCEYQSQRVSITLQLNAINQRTSYALVFLLVTDEDENPQIESSEQVAYIGQHSCSMKVNRYLLYSQQRKNISKNYSVIVHAFDKTQMRYIQSWRFTIDFLFLPVNRLVKTILIPHAPATVSYDCARDCRHGQCVQYANAPRFFCHCASGWSSVDCRIALNRETCSNDSLCVGAANNRSICVCPIGKSGPRCLLRSFCPPDACQNGGQCVAADMSIAGSSYRCICSEQFFGLRCERRQDKLAIYIDELDPPSHVIAYVISTSNTSEPTTTVVLQKLTLFQRVVTFRIAVRYHLAMIAANSRFYLAAIQQKPRKQIITSIHSQRECPLVETLFDANVLVTSRLRRVKLFHQLCEKNAHLQCFIDETYLCLCTDERHANCMGFDHRGQNLHCSERRWCKNGGQCLQDHPSCPSVTICVCPPCFFGNQCQFYTKGLGLTLDEILGYEIERNVKLAWQPFAVRFGAILTMIMFVLGFVDAILSIVTFADRTVQEVGCGMYLFASSIISLVIVVLFTLKFWVLFASHFDFSVRRQLVISSGFVIEIPLKIALYLSNWLHACVAMERAYSIHKSFHFNRQWSRYVAKKAVIGLPVLITALMIPQFIHMFVFDDEKEDRSWCVIEYHPWLQTYNLTMITFHFVGPLVANLLSSAFIVITTARQRAAVRQEEHYWTHLRAKLQQHRHLLISPLLLVMLSVLHVIITLSLDCHNSSRRFWFHLTGYFLSFVPSTFIFLIFVPPSGVYKKAFQLVCSNANQ